MYDLFYTTRPEYSECELRWKVLTLFNDIWQSYLIEKEQKCMINKSDKKYAKIITDRTDIKIETIHSQKTKPYRKYDTQSPLFGANNDIDIDYKENSLYDDAANHWCTPIEGNEKVIIIRSEENGQIIKKITVPSVMIFGSIAFGLDGIGSDMDLALPAGIYSLALFYKT